MFKHYKYKKAKKIVINRYKELIEYIEFISDILNQQILDLDYIQRIISNKYNNIRNKFCFNGFSYNDYISYINSDEFNRDIDLNQIQYESKKSNIENIINMELGTIDISHLKFICKKYFQNSSHLLSIVNKYEKLINIYNNDYKNWYYPTERNKKKALIKEKLSKLQNDFI